MIDGQRILGVIPARGRSVGVPRKNIVPLAGVPLLCYSIRSAVQSRYIDCLIVSTDDPEIKSIGEAEGCIVIDRPANIAGPEASTESAVLHALDYLKIKNEPFDFVVILEPTSPFRSVETIDGAIDMIVSCGGQSLLGVRESSEVVGILSQGFFCPLIPDEPRRRQDRCPKYIEASTIYVCRVEFLRRTEKLACDDWLAYVVPPMEAIDLNEVQDFAYAEFLISKRRDNE